MRRYTSIVIVLSAIVLLNIVAQLWIVRIDLTDDKRYTLSPATQALLEGLDEPLTVSLYLDGELNAGFRRLQTATIDLCEELSIYAGIEHQCGSSADAEALGLRPIVIHEREQNGRTQQTMVYPYLQIRYKGKSTMISLLRNQRGLSGEENLNQSIENIEYAVAEAIYSLTREQTPKIAFIEGHNELPEKNVYDISNALSQYFQIDRGVLGDDPEILNDYQAIIIADPQQPFSESDKYILDYYVQRGGNILWVINGVMFSSETLAESGYTPAIPLDLNLTDMFFRYGVRIAPALVQDVQCLPIPVDVSSDPQQPNYQPMPWCYAPLLLTSNLSPITRNIAEISTSFVSPIETVGGEDGLRKEILIATSSASRIIGTPAEVDLGELNPDYSLFTHQYVPVGISVEGVFPSAFAHRMTPAGIRTTAPIEAARSARQVFIASGSIIRNDWQQGQPLPVGFDRYSQMQFGNRDLLVNAILWMTDSEGLIQLRNKIVSLRLLNDKRTHEERLKTQLISTLTPVIALALIGLLFAFIHKNIYTKS